jgi:hypothetical protein
MGLNPKLELKARINPCTPFSRPFAAGLHAEEEYENTFVIGLA